MGVLDQVPHGQGEKVASGRVAVQDLGAIGVRKLQVQALEVGSVEGRYGEGIPDGPVAIEGVEEGAARYGRVPQKKETDVATGTDALDRPPDLLIDSGSLVADDQDVLGMKSLKADALVLIGNGGGEADGVPLGCHLQFGEEGLGEGITAVNNGVMDLGPEKGLDLGPGRCSSDYDGLLVPG